VKGRSAAPGCRRQFSPRLWALQLFERKHPDYKQHEQDMVKFGVLLPPSDRMNPMDYLEALYLLAKSDIPR
jgi:hypothetical protein